MLVMTDKELIEYHGGATKVAELLNLDKSAGGVQRVHNWIERGIPAKVKLEHPELFLREFPSVANAAASIRTEDLKAIEKAERDRNGGVRKPGDAKQRDNIAT